MMATAVFFLCFPSTATRVPCNDVGRLGSHGIMAWFQICNDQHCRETWVQLDEGCLDSADAIFPRSFLKDLNVPERRLINETVPMADGTTPLRLERALYSILQLSLCHDHDCTAILRTLTTNAISFGDVGIPVLCLFGQERLRIQGEKDSSQCCNGERKCVKTWPIGGLSAAGWREGTGPTEL